MTAIAAIVCVICCAAAFAACDDPEGKAVTVTENDTFKTESKAIWVFVGGGVSFF